MVKQVSKTIAADCNLFNTKTATVGWVSEEGSLADDGFQTGDYIPVQQGDVITFGAAVTTQGWHLVAYDRMRRPFPKVTLHNGISIFQHLNEETSIMQYTVGAGVHYVRLICETRYMHTYLVTKNQVFTAEEYRALMNTSTPGSILHLHVYNHRYWTLILNLQGEGTIYASDGQEIRFCPGSIVCVPPDVAVIKHSIEGFSDIHLVADTFAPGEQAGGKLIVTRDDKSQSVEALMLLMLRIYWNAMGQNDRLLEQLYVTVAQILLYQWREQQPQHHQVNRMISTMLAGFTDVSFSLEQVFQAENYCPNHLRRLFKKETGCTPLEYLIHLRINHAKKLMRENQNLQASVTQIAFMSGFQDACYFSRLFKKKVGVSPIQYMKNFTMN